MKIQAQIPPALCALHNFIRYHDPSDITDFDNVPNLGTGSELEHGEHGELSTGAVGPPERERAGTRRDQIANEMWDQYLLCLQTNGDDYEVVPS